MNRRDFVKTSAMAGAGLAMMKFSERYALAFYQSPTGISKFTNPFRGVGPGGIPVAAPDAFAAPVTGVTHYSLAANQYQDVLHPALGPTNLWGYNPLNALGGGIQPQRHLGGIIVAQRGVPIQLTVTNNLPPKHILPVDVSANMPDAAMKFMGNGHNAITVHLHGGLVPWISDGGPDTWFTPTGQYGMSAQFGGTNIYRLLNPGLLPGQGEYYYPNDQSARMMWYHDHAHDITRLNAYAGIATAYIIRDAFEGNLRSLGLPDFVENGGYELPIVIQEKIFVGANILTVDPTWTGPTTPGSLWYPHIYEKTRWGLKGNKPGTGSPTNTPPPDPSIIPEMFGDTMLANGTVYPQATVEARRYRVRLLNATQARFLNLQLYVDDGSVDSITLNPATLAPTNVKGPDFFVLGTEGGFLANPVVVPGNVPFNPVTMTGSLVTAPAERWDMIIDFTGFAGKQIVMYNDAPAPFPMGDPRNDYFPGAPKTQPTITQPGFGPNTRQIMRFNVVPAISADPPLAITTGTSMTAGIDPALVPFGANLVVGGALQLPPGIPVRRLTLNETFDAYGRLIQLLGTDLTPTKNAATFGRAYMDVPTETPLAGTTEVWEILNLTADTHPMHFHLVNVQVLGRQPFKTNYAGGLPSYTGPATPPEPTENGWKETVKCPPGQVTTVIMKFALPTVPFSVPTSPKGGHEYVWHCHILEHEEHDMMRPLLVL
jgi:spore coat protein A